MLPESELRERLRAIDPLAEREIAANDSRRLAAGTGNERSVTETCRASSSGDSTRSHGESSGSVCVPNGSNSTDGLTGGLTS